MQNPIDRTQFSSMQECIDHFRKVWNVPKELEDQVFQLFIEDFISKGKEHWDTIDTSIDIYSKKPRPTFTDDIIHEGKVQIYNTPEEIAEVERNTKYLEINPLELLDEETAQKLIKTLS